MQQQKQRATKKHFLFILVIIIITLPLITAHNDHEDFTEAEAIINQGLPCEELTNEQLEMLGDYFMEQMHPGEAHTLMDERMGGEGSTTLRYMHRAMGKKFYCNDDQQGIMRQRMMMDSFQNGFATSGMMPSGMAWYAVTPYNILTTVLLILIFITAIIILIITLFQQKKKQHDQR